MAKSETIRARVESKLKADAEAVLDKLGLRDRVHAVVYGYEHGLVEPGQAG